MRRRPLGTGGPLVAPIGLGCMSFGGFYGPTDRRESHETLARALDLGIDHLDTANRYGDGISEEVIGGFIKDRPNSFTIATKAGIEPKPTRHYDNSPAYLRRCLEDSLRRLGVEHVHLYYIHRREQARPVEEVMETLVRFKEEGKIGAIGLSEIAPSTLERAAAVHPVAAVQSEYSLWTRQPELGLVQACARHGAALVAFSPLGRGMLSGTFPTIADLPDRDFRKANPRFAEPNFAANRSAITRFADYARSLGHSPASMALAWVVAQAPHVVAIPGTRSARHLDELAGAFAIELSTEQRAMIEKLLPLGFAHGDRYSDTQINGIERYC
ncbi:MAG: aldo/keto reductase [Rhizobiaceae bacterium]|nr:aldo/keto reductase [Rhizobiaceae bacterium]